MKKIILLFLLTLTGCFNSSNSSLEVEKNPYENIPVKNEPDGFTIEASSVNTRNIDNYLFRDDTMYVDLRYYSWVLSQGHIAGFSFFPFYELIAAMDNSENDNKLFSYKKESPICEVGSFSPNYEESEFLLYNLFPKDKYIFAISQSGLECVYFFNLLVQYGYDASKLYNIGGFSNGTGLYNIAYIDLENPRYLVKGNPILDGSIKDITYDFMNGLTPLE